MTKEKTMTRCHICGRVGVATPCSDACHQHLAVADCEASGHTVSGDYCYCGLVSADGV